MVGATAARKFPWLRWTFIAIALIILVIMALRWVHGWRPDRALYPVQGVAMGAANGEAVHWGQLRAAGADFAYIDASIGAGKRDKHYVENREMARASKMKFGAIHHYDLCALASDQAANFDQLVPRDADAMPTLVALDYRDGCTDHPTQAMLEGELTSFLNLIETHMGRRAIIAPSPAISDDYSFAALKRPLLTTRNFFAPKEGEAWRMWQASDKAHIAGADGNVRWIVINPKK